MEAGESQDLQDELARQRLRKADGMVSVWVQRPENQESQWCSFSLKAGRPETQEGPMFQFQSECRKKLMSSSKAVSQEEFSVTQGRVSFFVLFRPSTHWIRPTHMLGNLLYPVCLSICLSIYLFIYTFIYLFVYFWLHWVFVAACRLSLVVASGGYFLLWCAGFSLWWLLLLWLMDSRAQAQ